MQSRMANPAVMLPNAMKALQELSKVAHDGSVPSRTLGLVHLRASQINGCAVCVDQHPKLMKKDGETDERLFAVSVWRDAPYFTEAERAALALTEAVTRLADKNDGVPDDVWNEAARHFDRDAMAKLLLAISTVNVWNRLNVATRQVAGLSWT